SRLREFRNGTRTCPHYRAAMKFPFRFLETATRLHQRSLRSVSVPPESSPHRPAAACRPSRETPPSSDTHASAHLASPLPISRPASPAQAPPHQKEKPFRQRIRPY